MSLCESGLHYEFMERNTLAFFENVIEIKGMIIKFLGNLNIIQFGMEGNKLFYLFAKRAFLCFAVGPINVNQKNLQICALNLLIFRCFFHSLVVDSSEICFGIKCIFDIDDVGEFGIQIIIYASYFVVGVMVANCVGRHKRKMAEILVEIKAEKSKARL